jgi:hypothetical protein
MAGALDSFGQAEIADLRPAILVQKDIRWLEIAMDDAALMSVGNGFSDVLAELGGFAGRQRAAFQMSRKAAPFP